MSKNQQGDTSSLSREENIGRRSQEDQQRDKSVYQYLLTCLTDLGINEENKKPNESSIANQWGQKNNRIFIRRVLRSVLTEYYDEQERYKVVPGLTLGKLVEILAGIQDYWAKKRLNTKEEQVPRILTRTEKLRAFRYLSQLTPEEKEKLDFPRYSGETLLQELLETVTDTVKGLKSEDIVPFYKGAINIYHSLKQFELKNQQYSKLASLSDIIKHQVEHLIEECYRGLNSALKREKTDDLVNKIHREFSRMEFQSGLRQVKSLLPEHLIKDEIKPDANLFYPSFIEHLTRSLVENEILTDEFPVHLKHIEIEKTSPLPLYVNKKAQSIGLLNPLILEQHEDQEDINGLQKQFAYKIKVHFYVKIPENYQLLLQGKDYQISYFNSRENKLEFFEEVSGIGSPVYHIIAAINRVLFWDIPELNDYLPVARNILNDHHFFGSPSLVYSYNLVNLCKKSDIEQAIRDNKNYDQVVNSYEPAYGEYCGFDLVEVLAKAALHARLRAIKQTGIDSVKYLTQLCNRVEEINALRKAESYLSFYPFSLKAMEGYLNQTIFKDRYRVTNNEFNFTEINSGQPWSAVAYDAHITITEAYLKEGLYRIAKKYLDILKHHVENAKKNNNNFLSDIILAQYELCLFRYHYLTDLEDSESRQLHSDRSSAIRAAIDSLNSAEEYLKKLLKKYYTISNSAQSNFHPFFYLLSRVYAHRAKLYIFTSSYTDRPSGRFSGLIEPIRLLEKARIYAARDGNPAHYAYWSAYQSWCYLMVAYLGDYEPLHQELSREECLDWARRLVEHALICYYHTGKLCYQQIKDNGGKITKNSRNGKYYESYGDIQIQVIPLIQELKEDSNECEQIYASDKNVINLDFSILKQIHNEENKSIYLFGTHSSILLFTMGMLELCTEENQKDELQLRIKKALRMFTYCSAIALDGTEIKENYDEGKLYLERILKQGDYLVRGLYPHRLTQFADLGKIWAATCKLILLIYNSSYTWQDINNLLKSLLQSLDKSIIDTDCGQERYNGHLESHYEKVVKYFEQVQEKKINFPNLEEIRNKVVRDIFKIMRGESDVRP
ncbi:HypX (modular protein) [Iningainema tapete]|uniref:HypX (Modular protein) n=1 Tax=Iningainema tapete BLCC-T55 TaxID=2748662 RepID=A0A8J7C6P4_9CYAN|nr:HypX (modular protein) [Iningainema tapete]MBD2774599.1 HypX (modular protein) [Iningainema tapete BLCC-T55]